MTKQEAIKRFQRMKKILSIPNSDAERMIEAIDMAIEALQEPKTIIGIDIPYGSDKGLATLFKGKDDKMVLEEVKEIVSVVRCKDCKHRDLFSCHLTDNDFQKDEDFCSWGERREP